MTVGGASTRSSMTGWSALLLLLGVFSPGPSSRLPLPLPLLSPVSGFSLPLHVNGNVPPPPVSGGGSSSATPSVGTPIAGAPVSNAAAVSAAEAVGSQLHRLTSEFRRCLRDLGSDPTDLEIERWACLIADSMGNMSRNFHTVEHVFDISHGADSIQTLAAMFHDVIYYNIDGGLSPAQAQILTGIVYVDDDYTDDVVRIAQDEGGGSGSGSFGETISMVMAVFGFTPGQTLTPFGGMNEFLSACVAARCLERTISTQDLLRIVACIEATVPFRTADSTTGSGNGKSMEEGLYDRLVKTNAQFLVGLTDDEIVRTVQRAVDLANRDVGNFAFTSSEFLINTWNLMPESNMPLRDNASRAGHGGGMFMASEFALAVNKMRNFFGYLQPEAVFHTFRGVPSNAEYQFLVERTRENLDVGRKYMNCKLLCASFVAAMAELTGGDAPVVLFGGACIPAEIDGQPDDSCATEINVREGVELDETVLGLLANTLGSELSSFQITNTATAPYLYGIIGDEGVERALEFAVVPMDRANARKLLDALPRDAVHFLLMSCSLTAATTRADALRRLALEYSKE